MTRSRYVFAALFQSFGVVRKTKRLTDAASEMHLMQDGEELLGAFCWRNLEEIEDLSMEYWNLRRLEREAETLKEKLGESENTLFNAQTNRADLVDRTKGMGQEMFEDRESLLVQIDTLNASRDEIMEGAAATKKRHAALQMKAQVLKEEGSENGDKLVQCREDLIALKQEFTESKSKLIEVDTKIDEHETQLAGIQQLIDDKLEGTKDEATESFAEISKANRDITKFRADLGLIQEEQAKIYREVGRFLNVNAERNDCRAACRNHRGLQNQTRLLYRSIQLNRKLVERVS